MSQYPKLTMTNSAIEMIAESQLSGTDLEITKVKIGDGLLLNDSDIQNMTDVVSARMEASVTSSKNDGNGQITITFAVGNERLDTGFFAREIGIFAKLTDGEEKLYAYTNAGNRCDWIPDKDTPIDSQIITATIVIGNAANVVVNIKDNAYALAIDIPDKLSQLINDVGFVTSKKISSMQPTYFYTSGTYTVPDEVTTLYVSGCAGGGGGSFCGGGGGGESIMRKQISVTPGESIHITIGTGGHASSTTGGSASVSSVKITSAGDGGNTIFGNYFTLQGGKGIAYNSSGAETQMPLAGGNGATNGGMCTLLRYNSENSVFWSGGKGGDSLFGKGGAGGSWSVGYALGSTNKSMDGGDGIGYGSGGGGFGSYFKNSRDYWTGAGAGANGFIMIEVV